MKQKNGTNVFKNRVTDIGNKFMVIGRKGGGINWEFGIRMNTLLCVVVHVLHVLLMHVTTWMNRLEIMLSEKS